MALAFFTSAVPSAASQGSVDHERGKVALLDTTDFAEARRVSDWIVATNDSVNQPFMVVDKANARLFLFDAAGKLRATTPVLLGLARGDDSPPEIGTRKLSEIAPQERITPAGRFVAQIGQDLDGSQILWIDYDTAIALHRASDRKPGLSSKSRLARLSSATPAEKRVSLGCINVSGTFYERFIQPTFATTNGIAYILPETRSADDQFGITSRDVSASS
ncbi:hypothetical protein GCM10007973_22880 [Polymorphobacter multimanifer]|uniref:L,D-transpeptidase n=1 Tax=Polymorphobacter multimanifer TaxID=1070431 RepID=UPI0019AB7237|nr:L,D-transpeptidase [Polymorphobacter multimanifer]GGI85746.1 hypothetical protein GCM10007973_22880 [Polymorphobacter multimanifer]